MDNQNQQPLPLRPLGIVKEVLEGIGSDVSYAYDDLVFISHNFYMLQFGERGEELFFIENTEATEKELEGQYELLSSSFRSCGIELQKKGKYSVESSGDENITLTFHDQ